MSGPFDGFIYYSNSKNYPVYTQLAINYSAQLMSEYKLALTVKNSCKTACIFYGILMNILACRNYVSYIVWSSYILTW